MYIVIIFLAFTLYLFFHFIFIFRVMLIESSPCNFFFLHTFYFSFSHGARTKRALKTICTLPKTVVQCTWACESRCLLVASCDSGLGPQWWTSESLLWSIKREVKNFYLPVCCVSLWPFRAVNSSHPFYLLTQQVCWRGRFKSQGKKSRAKHQLTTRPATKAQLCNLWDVLTVKAEQSLTGGLANPPSLGCAAWKQWQSFSRVGV